MRQGHPLQIRKMWGDSACPKQEEAELMGSRKPETGELRGPQKERERAAEWAGGPARCPTSRKGPGEGGGGAGLVPVLSTPGSVPETPSLNQGAW